MNKDVVNILKTLYSNIYHYKAPVSGTYPMVVYNCITNAPAQRADNRTYGSRVVYRVTVIDKLETPDTALRQAFEDAGWLWEGTTITQDVNENEIDEVYTSIDFSKKRCDYV